MKYLKEDFSLDSIPDGEPFVFILEDNLGNVYTEYKYTSDKKNIYNYRRLLFDGIDMNAEKTVEENGNEITKKFETLTLKAYYKDSVLLSEPYATITVYDTDHYHEPIELEKSPQKTPDMMNRTEYEIKEEPDKTDK